MVSLIVCTNREYAMENVFANYTRQEYPDKEMIIVLNSDRMNIESWKAEAEKHQNVTVFRQPEQVTLGECYNFAIPRAKYAYVAKIDDDDYYSPYYLSEAVRGIAVSGADVIGKSTAFIYYARQQLLTLFREGVEFSYIQDEKEMFAKFLIGATLLFRKDLFPDLSFKPTNIGEDTEFLRMCVQKGLRTYSTSRYNYAYIRYSNSGHHTSTLQEHKLLEKSRYIARTTHFHPVVTRMSEDIFVQDSE
ncbi:glycosyltransferase [Ectobacillus ponti]|uniref:Glycosyltransferase family 2 protein n=1 Tax=Ectobacillus ponti TaxID=2961894 RepID=A0AA41X3N6_9BACI|nr:glycosyltransferase family 2 protein [Ectobacillus ponti]